MMTANLKIKTVGKFLPGLLAGVGALAGVATLSGFSHSTNSLLLRLYAVGILLIIVLWSLWQFFRTRSKERDSRLEELTAEVKARRADLAEIAARQAATHTEELIITVTVGRTDGEDEVREDARMTPKPLVVYKPVRPIVPTDLDKPVSFEDMNIRVGVEESDDGQVHVQVTPLEAESGLLSLGLLFRPDLTKATNWWMEYNSPGLFAPFRKSGRDKIVWNNHMRNDPEGKSPLTSLEVRFVFLDVACNPNVTETGNLGTPVSRSRNEKGHWIIRWRDPNPGRLRYEWWITGRPIPPGGATGT
jgi:hypothetical protein